MTIRKKIAILLAKFVIILVFVPSLLLTIIFFYPHPRHWAFKKTPIETTALFEQPDSVVCRIDGKTKFLSNEEEAELYELLTWLFTGNMSDIRFKCNFDHYRVRSTQFTDEETCLIELRYNQRRRYTGDVYLKAPFEYDALLLYDVNYCCVVIPYLNFTYQSTFRGVPEIAPGDWEYIKEYVREL